MAKRGKNITPFEDAIIVAYVKTNPLNLCQAFENAAMDTKRTVNTIKCRWYHKLRDDKDVVFYINNGNPNIKNKIRK